MLQGSRRQEIRNTTPQRSSSSLRLSGASWSALPRAHLSSCACKQEPRLRLSSNGCREARSKRVCGRKTLRGSTLRGDLISGCTTRPLKPPQFLEFPGNRVFIYTSTLPASEPQPLSPKLCHRLEPAALSNHHPPFPALPAALKCSWSEQDGAGRSQSPPGATLSLEKPLSHH